MDFWQAIKSFYGRYFDFETRSSRSEYWWPKLFKSLVYFVLFIIFGIGAGISEGANSGASNAGNIAIIITMLPLSVFFIANIIPNIAVAVRRFHDQDQSGWMFLLRLIPYVGGIIVMIFMCIDGTHGENRFGEDPLGDSMFDTFS